MAPNASRRKLTATPNLQGKTKISVTSSALISWDLQRYGDHWHLVADQYQNQKRHVAATVPSAKLVVLLHSKACLAWVVCQADGKRGRPCRHANCRAAPVDNISPGYYHYYYYYYYHCYY